MPVKHYASKRVVVPAVEWTGSNIMEVAEFMGHAEYTHYPEDNQLDVHTAEGTMKAHAGDFIIKDMRGKFYPCAPDVFAHKYEETSIVHPEYRPDVNPHA